MEVITTHWEVGSSILVRAEDACTAPRSFQVLEEPERGRIGNGKGGKETKPQTLHHAIVHSFLNWCHDLFIMVPSLAGFDQSIQGQLRQVMWNLSFSWQPLPTTLAKMNLVIVWHHKQIVCHRACHHSGTYLDTSHHYHVTQVIHKRR